MNTQTNTEQNSTEHTVNTTTEAVESATPTLPELFGTTVYVLDFPYRLADGRILKEVKMTRRATVNDARQARRIAGDDQAMYEQALMAICSGDGLTAEDFGGMDLSDYGKIQNHFRGKSTQG